MEPSEPEPHRITAPAPTKRCGSLRLRLHNTDLHIGGSPCIFFYFMPIIAIQDHFIFLPKKMNGFVPLKRKNCEAFAKIVLSMRLRRR
jgi:hypothetical protein